MNNKKYTKHALFGSVIALILCCAMLVGTTFAWFTDTASTSGNKIQAGTLDVDLEVLGQDGKWSSIADMDAAIFDYNNWEPGYTQVKVLRVVNNGSLALKWKAMLVSTATELTKLADVIDVYVKEDIEAYPAERNDLEGWTKVGTLADFVNTIEETTIGSIDADKKYETLGIAFKMQEEAGNEYQNMNLGGAFDICIIATQLEAELDSFGPDYDAGASLDGVMIDKVYTVDNLPTDAEFKIKANENVVINLNGGEMAKTYVQANGKLTINDGTVKSGTPGNYAIISRNEIILNDVDIVSGGGGVSAAAGAKLTVNGGSVHVDADESAGRYCVYAGGEGTEITINGGTYSFNAKTHNRRAYIYAMPGATVYVNGGTFGAPSSRSGYNAGIMGDGTVIITGGTFGFDPTIWVAEGYQAVKSDSTWTVSAL